MFKSVLFFGLAVGFIAHHSRLVAGEASCRSLLQVAKLLIITHQLDDEELIEATKAAARNHVNVLALESSSFPYPRRLDEIAAHRLESGVGELPVRIHAEEIHFAGGNCLACLKRSIEESVNDFSEHGDSKNLVVVLHMNAIYGASMLGPDGADSLGRVRSNETKMIRALRDSLVRSWNFPIDPPPVWRVIAEDQAPNEFRSRIVGSNAKEILLILRW